MHQPLQPAGFRRRHWPSERLASKRGLQYPCPPKQFIVLTSTFPRLKGAFAKTPWTCERRNTLFSPVAGNSILRIIEFATSHVTRLTNQVRASYFADTLMLRCGSGRNRSEPPQRHLVTPCDGLQILLLGAMGAAPSLLAKTYDNVAVAKRASWFRRTFWMARPTWGKVPYVHLDRLCAQGRFCGEHCGCAGRVAEL